MSSYRIEFAPAAARQLKKLQKNKQVRIAAKIDALSAEPRPDGCRKLKGTENIYRIRAGDLRILYEIRDQVLVVLVVSIRRREEVYRGLPGA